MPAEQISTEAGTTPAEIANLYSATRSTLAARNVFLRDIVTPVYPGRVWNRQGRILTGSGGAADPRLAYTTTDCQLIANPCFQMWYDDSTGVRYAESANALPPWTVYPSTVLTGHAEASVLKVAGFSFKYLMLTRNTGGNNIDAYTGSIPTTFALAAANAITTASVGNWSPGQVDNSSMVQVGSTIYAAVEGPGSGCAGFTSTNGTTWTISPANLISGTGDVQSGAGCFIWQNPATSTWYMWTHVPNGGGLYRRSSSAFDAIWQVSAPSAYQIAANEPGTFHTFSADAPDESTQLAVPSLVEVNGRTYMVYCASGSDNSLAIKLAIANMPMSQLVQTGEGEVTTAP
jgi:hypothetical protein